jgi:Leucine-rich repeat (LRR) protein
MLERLKTCDKYLDLSNCDLKEIPKDIPVHVEYLFLSDNKITKIDNIDHLINLQAIDLSSNRLVKLDNLPENIQEISARNNKLNDISYIIKLKDLKRLDISYNKITVIPTNYAESIVADYNCISTLQYMPFITSLICSYNLLESISGDNIPVITELDCSNNKIKCIQNFNCLELLHCSYNLLGDIKNIPRLKYLDCTDNPLITRIEYFKNLEELICSYNKDLKISSKYNIKNTHHCKNYILITMTI